jgi:hypothetical protein
MNTQANGLQAVTFSPATGLGSTVATKNRPFQGSSVCAISKKDVGATGENVRSVYRNLVFRAFYT